MQRYTQKYGLVPAFSTCFSLHKKTQKLLPCYFTSQRGNICIIYAYLLNKFLQYRTYTRSSCPLHNHTFFSPLQHPTALLAINIIHPLAYQTVLTSYFRVFLLTKNHGHQKLKLISRNIFLLACSQEGSGTYPSSHLSDGRMLRLCTVSVMSFSVIGTRAGQWPDAHSDTKPKRSTSAHPLSFSHDKPSIILMHYP